MGSLTCGLNLSGVRARHRSTTGWRSSSGTSRPPTYPEAPVNRTTGRSAFSGSGGGIVFGGNGYWQYFGAIKALLTNGSVNTTGDIAFSTRGTVNDSSLTERMRILGDGKIAFGNFAGPISAMQQYTNTSANR